MKLQSIVQVPLAQFELIKLINESLTNLGVSDPQIFQQSVAKSICQENSWEN